MPIATPSHDLTVALAKLAAAEQTGGVTLNGSPLGGKLVVRYIYSLTRHPYLERVSVNGCLFSVISTQIADGRVLSIKCSGAVARQIESIEIDLAMHPMPPLP